jgi:hypothetical protein
MNPFDSNTVFDVGPAIGVKHEPLPFFTVPNDYWVSRAIVDRISKQWFARDLLVPRFRLLSSCRVEVTADRYPDKHQHPQEEHFHAHLTRLETGCTSFKLREYALRQGSSSSGLPL